MLLYHESSKRGGGWQGGQEIDHKMDEDAKKRMAIQFVDVECYYGNHHVGEKSVVCKVCCLRSWYYKDL